MSFNKTLRLSAFLCLAPFLNAQSSLSGYWQLTAPRGDGTFRVTNLQLQQSGEDLSGSLLSRDGIPLAAPSTPVKSTSSPPCPRLPPARRSAPGSAPSPLTAPSPMAS